MLSQKFSESSSIIKGIDISLNFIATLFAFLFFVLSASEFYTIGILKDYEGYPFGSECAPDNYDTPELYASSVLISGIYFGFILLFQLINWKKRFVKGYIVFGVTFLYRVIS